MTKIAILSNVNINPVVRLLPREISVFQNQGYGNEIGYLLDSNSALNKFEPNIIFLIEDVFELIHHTDCVQEAKIQIAKWFEQLDGTLCSSQIYYISDVYLWGEEIDVLEDLSYSSEIESLWYCELKKIKEKNPNVRIFPYRQMICNMGAKNAFSSKMWYMGKIIHSTAMQKQICEAIVHFIRKEEETSKKVLVLDLDNTLWGGLAGENDHNAILLSDDGEGLIFKNLQRIICQIKKQGVILAIVSKNNEDDAIQIIKNHPHMILRESDFAIKKINWESKSKNIMEIASELNVGIDSMVFFDDNPAEREEVKQLLDGIIVPDFPAKRELLPEVMRDIWKNYFSKTIITEEDRVKTEQYLANEKRKYLEKQTRSIGEYLHDLNIELIQKKETENVDRILQLLNKTNQFNLTTKRHTRDEIQNMITSDQIDVFAYQVKDCFGDNGLVAVLVISREKDNPVITEFVMSCRVMGKRIEYGIIDHVEQKMRQAGYERLDAIYVETKKNKPVNRLYDELGYGILEESASERIYSLGLDSKKDREYYLTITEERKTK